VVGVSAKGVVGVSVKGAAGLSAAGVVGGGSSSASVLAAIWQEHRAGVLERVTSLEAAVSALDAGALDSEQCAQARHSAHMLVGSVGTFGFMRGSEVARRLEHELLEPAIEQAPALLALIAELRDELQQGESLAGAGAAPAAAAALKPIRGIASEPAPERPRLVVVDDDDRLCESLKLEALALGIDCETAASPERARALCRIRVPDVVLLDLTFADGAADAYELLSELTSETPAIPVVIFTGSDAFTDRVEAARRGGRAYLSKSLSPTQVLDAVRELLDRERLAATRVLIVDDDCAMLDAMRALLEPHNLEVSGLADPLLFWETLERVSPELLILDVDMPGVNGPELCRTVRNDPLWSRLAVIFATARTDPATIERVFQAGADDYVTKPIVGPELVTRVTNRLDRVRMYRTQAETDSLTGLANRAKSGESLRQLMAFADRFSEPMSVAMLDLDRFKLINDRHGHASGDRVL
jgi:PleD family two-component response regulator